MAHVLERDTAPEAIDKVEATLNYIVDDGSKIFTVTANPGGTAVRSGGTPDPRRVTVHNGRPYAKELALERDGLPGPLHRHRRC